MHEATWISDRGCPIGKWRLLDDDRQGGRTRSSSSSWDQTSRASEGLRLRWEALMPTMLRLKKSIQSFFVEPSIRRV